MSLLSLRRYINKHLEPAEANPLTRSITPLKANFALGTGASFSKKELEL